MTALFRLSALMGDTRIYPGIPTENIPITYKPMNAGVWDGKPLTFQEIVTEIFEVPDCRMLINAMIKPVFKGTFTSTYMGNIMASMRWSHKGVDVYNKCWTWIKIFASLYVTWDIDKYWFESPLLVILQKKILKTNIGESVGVPTHLTWTVGAWIREEYFLKYTPKFNTKYNKY